MRRLPEAVICHSTGRARRPFGGAGLCSGSESVGRRTRRGWSGARGAMGRDPVAESLANRHWHADPSRAESRAMNVNPIECETHSIGASLRGLNKHGRGLWLTSPTGVPATYVGCVAAVLLVNRWTDIAVSVRRQHYGCQGNVTTANRCLVPSSAWCPMNLPPPPFPAVSWLTRCLTGASAAAAAASDGPDGSIRWPGRPWARHGGTGSALAGRARTARGRRSTGASPSRPLPTRRQGEDRIA
jgi:hypothetical protein